MAAYCDFFPRSRFIALVRTVFVLVGLVQMAVVLMQYSRTTSYESLCHIDENITVHCHAQARSQ